jgi:Pyruvate/2-oxoacid:ferredoxin oxidoreductase delta subunit
MTFDQATLDAHRSIHMDIDLSCEKCHMVLPDQATLEEHSETHMDTDLTCEKCNEVLAD